MKFLVPVARSILSSLYVVAVVTGLALGLGFIAPVLSVAAIGGVFGCLFLITRAKSAWYAGVYLGIAWTIKSLCALLWFWSAYPIEWIALASPLIQIIIISFYWITGALWLGFGGALFGLVANYLTSVKSVPRFIWYISVPVLWVAGELVGALTFSFVTLGPGSYLQSFFSFGFIGYLFGYVPVGLLLAPVGGVYGLSIALVALGVLGFVSYYRFPLRYTLVILCLMGSAAVIPVTVSPLASRQVTAVSINTSFDAKYLSTPEGQQGRAHSLNQAINEALQHNPQFIILPEDSRYLESQFGYVTSSSTVNKFLFIHPASDAVIIDSGRTDLIDGTSVLRAHMVDTRGNQVIQFDKQYLVPQGEYVPYIYGSIMRFFGYGPLIAKIERDSSYRPGSLVQTSTLAAHLPAILFCFESVRPFGVGAITKGRTVPFVAHPISHAWFHSSRVLWQQLDVMLQIQARRTGVPIVSAGNMVPGKLYAPNGVIETGTLLSEGERYELRLFSF